MYIPSCEQWQFRHASREKTMTEPRYEVRYYSVAETAKCIRVVLKKAFPAVKFSVTSKTYSGGGSVRVSWTDGPTTKAVDAITAVFSGQGFDGMIDMAYNIEAWVLNGAIVGTRSRGTEGSRGTVPAWGMIPPHDDCELVSFCANSVHTDRAISPALARKASEQIAAYYGVTMPAVVEYVGWDKRPAWKLENDSRVQIGSNFSEYPSTLIYQAASDHGRFQRSRD